MSAIIVSSITGPTARRTRRRQRHRNPPHSAGAVANVSHSWETESEEDCKIVRKRASSMGSNINRFQLLHPTTPAPGAQFTQSPVLTPPKSAFTFRCSQPSSATPKAIKDSTMSSTTTISPAEASTPIATRKHTIPAKTAKLANITDPTSTCPLTPMTLSRINAALPDTVKIPAVDTAKHLPKSANESEAPLTKDGKSRFYPGKSISSTANTNLQEPICNLYRTRTTKRRPAPLNLVDSSFAESCNVKGLAPETVIRLGNVARKPLVCRGDQSRVRIETAGYIPEDMKGWMADEGYGSESSGWEGEGREFWT